MIRKVSLSLLVLCLLSACTAAPALSETDEIEIYAAVVEQIYTQDDTYGGTLNAPTVYILTHTDDSVGAPDIDQTAAQTLSPAVQTEISDALAHLPARIIWVADRSAVPTDTATGAVADQGVVITLGNIHSQRGGTAHVSGSIYIASLAAGGQTYVLEPIGGVWRVSRTTGARWVS
jgi:hypothetical protein